MIQNFWEGMVKNGCGQCELGTLNLTLFLKNEQMKSTNFLQAGRNPVYFFGGRGGGVGGGYGKWMWLIYKPDADL